MSEVSEESSNINQEQIENQNGVNKTPEGEKAKEKEPEKRYTDADVDKMIDKKFAEWNKKRESEEKQKAEAAKLAAMNEEQKQEATIKELTNRLNDLEREKNLTEMTKTARALLAEEGVNISDDLLTKLVTDDADSTKTAIDDFLKMYRADVEKAVKERLKGTTPKTGTTSGLTKDQIMKVENTEERQRLINEHLELFTGGR